MTFSDVIWARCGYIQAREGRVRGPWEASRGTGGPAAAVTGPAAGRMRYAMGAPGTSRGSGGPERRPRSLRRPGDWLSGRAPRSHRGGHWFDPSIAHQAKHAVARAPDGAVQQ